MIVGGLPSSEGWRRFVSFFAWLQIVAWLVPALLAPALYVWVRAKRARARRRLLLGTLSVLIAAPVLALWGFFIAWDVGNWRTSPSLDSLSSAYSIPVSLALPLMIIGLYLLLKRSPRRDAVR